MPKFNKASVGTQTTNLAGGKAYTSSPELELVSLLLSSFVEDQYYEKADDALQRLTLLIGQCDPVFAMKAAIYARQEFGMRSISHAAAVAIAINAKGCDNALLRQFACGVVRRVDDITEIVALWKASHEGKATIQGAFRKGLADALGTKFDRYQLGKYRAEDKTTKLVDALNVLHPKPGNEEVAQAFKDLVNGELRSEATWEVGLTEAGQAGDVKAAKAAVWKQLVDSRRIPHFALLRNLRNITEQADEATLDNACTLLQDEGRILKSLVLPFRYLAALKNTTHPVVQRSIARALDTSIGCVPRLPGLTAVVTDSSGSMSSSVSQKSSMTRLEVGAVMAAIVARQSCSPIGHFANSFEYIRYNPDEPALTIAERVVCRSGTVGHGTNMPSIFEGLDAVDRIVVVSDMQTWMGGGVATDMQTRMGGGVATAFAKWKARHNKPDARLYLLDVSGYGQLVMPERNVWMLAGFSDKVFTLLGLLEQDQLALVHAIEEVEL